MTNTNASSGVTCPVCGTLNSEHASVCVSCKSYLQNRVINLDLFAIAWQIIEHPEQAMRLVARAENKNFALFLSAAGGVLPMSQFLHAYRVGEALPSLLAAIGLTLAAGLVLGLLIGLLFGLTGTFFEGVFRTDKSFRNTLSLFAYALVPSVIMGLFTLPIQWLTFGMQQFTSNPHPETINAVSYWTLNTLQYAAQCWTIVLLLLGLKVGLRTSFGKSFAVSFAGLVVVYGSTWWVLTRIYAAILQQ